MIGVALVGLAVFFIWQRQKRRETAARDHATNYGPLTQELDVNEGHNKLDKTSRVEMEQPHIVNELEGQPIHGDRSSPHHVG